MRVVKDNTTDPYEERITRDCLCFCRCSRNIVCDRGFCCGCGRDRSYETGKIIPATRVIVVHCRVDEINSAISQVASETANDNFVLKYVSIHNRGTWDSIKYPKEVSFSLSSLDEPEL